MPAAPAIGAIAGVVGAGASLYGALNADSGASGSINTDPEDWATIGYGSYGMWLDFMNAYYGGSDIGATIDAIDMEIDSLQRDVAAIQDRHGGSPPKESNLDIGAVFPDYKYTERTDYQDAINRIADLQASREALLKNYDPENPPMSLRDMFQEDQTSRQEASESYLTREGIEAARLSGRSKGITDQYGKRLGEIEDYVSTPTQALNLGGKNYGLIGKGQLQLADRFTSNAREEYDTDITQAQLENLLNRNVNQQTLLHNTTYTPNASTLAYYDWLWPKLSEIQSWRSRTPTQTEQFNYNPGLTEKVAAGTELTNSLLNLYNTLRNRQDTTPQPSDANQIYTPVTGST